MNITIFVVAFAQQIWERHIVVPAMPQLHHYIKNSNHDKEKKMNCHYARTNLLTSRSWCWLRLSCRNFSISLCLFGLLSFFKTSKISSFSSLLPRIFGVKSFHFLMKIMLHYEILIESYNLLIYCWSYIEA